MGKSKELFMQMQEEFYQTCQEVETGEMYILDAFIRLKEMQKQAQELAEYIKTFEAENALEIETEINKYNQQYKEKKFEVRNGGVIYNFNNIYEYRIAKDNLKEIEEKYKQAYKLKQSGHAMIDESTGEELQIPEISYRKSSIIVK